VYDSLKIQSVRPCSGAKYIFMPEFDE